MHGALRMDDGFERPGDGHAHRAAHAQMQAAARAFGDTGDDTALRDATRALATEAVLRGMRAEELVIAFKQLWTTIPELSPLRRKARPVVDELVTLCINEYYRRREGASR
jgi:hypothetical protein